MKLGALIKRYRADHRISQRDLSDRLTEQGYNVPAPTIAGWELGKRSSETDWNSDFLVALERALDLAPGTLFIDLGFSNGVPAELDPEAVMIARELSDIASDEKRQRLYDAIRARPGSRLAVPFFPTP
jgi:transcriptional regulator with XRE-family HTH domain